MNDLAGANTAASFILNKTELGRQVWASLPVELQNKINNIFLLSAIFLILIIVYLLILIIVKILAIRNAREIRKIRKIVEEINIKLDNLPKRKSEKDNLQKKED